MDEDRDCHNARHELLIAESTAPVGFKTSEGCHVVSGNWSDPNNLVAVDQGRHILVRYNSKTIETENRVKAELVEPER